MAVNELSSSNIKYSMLIPASSNAVFTNLVNGTYAISSTPNTTFSIDGTSGTISIPNGIGVYTVSDPIVIINTSTSPIQVLMSQIKANLVSAGTLTLDTVSTTSTYTQTGTAYKVVAIGGGSAGVGWPGAGPVGGPGGPGGRVVFQSHISLPGNIPVVVGSGGVWTPGATSPTPGGATSFGPLSTTSPTALQASGGTGYGPPTPSASWPNAIGQPGAPVIAPSGALSYIPGNFSGGWHSNAGPRPGTAGGIAAGGGAGVSYARPGGGGGGAVPGGAAGYYASSAGNGGNGGVFVLRFP